MTDDGELLTTEFGQKLMELNAITVCDTSMPSDVYVLVSNVLNNSIENYKEELDIRNAEYVNYELEKYEYWSDDKLVLVENEVRELRKLIDSIHRQTRKETDVKQKLLLKRQEIEIDGKLRKKQCKLFELEDEYRKAVDECRYAP